MGLNSPPAPAREKQDLRTEVLSELGARYDIATKIKGMAEEISEKLFGPPPTTLTEGPEKTSPAPPPLGLEQMFFQAQAQIRVVQSETHDILQRIINKL